MTAQDLHIHNAINDLYLALLSECEELPSSKHNPALTELILTLYCLDELRAQWQHDNILSQLEIPEKQQALIRHDDATATVFAIKWTRRLLKHF